MWWSGQILPKQSEQNSSMIYNIHYLESAIFTIVHECYTDIFAYHTSCFFRSNKNTYSETSFRICLNSQL